MAEVELGKVAQQKASDSQVKSFAERMVTDHSKANDELKSIAGGKGVTLPTSLDKDHQKDSDKMQRLQGPEFDREYMKHMVADHKKTVADFEKQAKSGKDNEVKQFAAKNLPTIQEHLKMAQQLEQSTKSGKAGSASSSKSSGGSSGSGSSASSGSSTGMSGSGSASGSGKTSSSAGSTPTDSTATKSQTGGTGASTTKSTQGKSGQ
jgi:putative membrane protein